MIFSKPQHRIQFNSLPRTRDFFARHMSYPSEEDFLGLADEANEFDPLSKFKAESFFWLVGWVL